MSTIHVHCSHEGKVIGRGLSRYVKRDHIRSAFWRDMEGPCQELSRLLSSYSTAMAVSRRNSRITQSGWEQEFGAVSLTSVHSSSSRILQVDQEWRHKGVGKRIALLLVEKARSGRREPDFSLAIPGYLTRDVKYEIEGKTKLEQREVKFRAEDVARSFWRSLGFRRIGASCCFGPCKRAKSRSTSAPLYRRFRSCRRRA
jgi:GNAT superfamily N-acetyltransferase